MQTQEIKQRLETISARIAAAAVRAGRDPDDVELVAVSKTVAADRIAAAYAAGQRIFGENYVAELADKAAALPADIAWHQIGPVQRRAVPRLPTNLAMVQTLDRIELLARFARVRAEPWPPFLIQVNIGRETQKTGVMPDDAEGFLESVLTDFPQARVRGLMAIPPADLDERGTRRHFAALRELAERLGQRLGLTLRLSMGMSGDFEWAVAEGAHWVRVGSAIFGERPA